MPIPDDQRFSFSYKPVIRFTELPVASCSSNPNGFLATTLSSLSFDVSSPKQNTNIFLLQTLLFDLN